MTMAPDRSYEDDHTQATEALLTRTEAVLRQLDEIHCLIQERQERQSRRGRAE